MISKDFHALHFFFTLTLSTSRRHYSSTVSCKHINDTIVTTSTHVFFFFFFFDEIQFMEIYYLIRAIVAVWVPHTVRLSLSFHIAYIGVSGYYSNFGTCDWKISIRCCACEKVRIDFGKCAAKKISPTEFYLLNFRLFIEFLNGIENVRFQLNWMKKKIKSWPKTRQWKYLKNKLPNTHMPYNCQRVGGNKALLYCIDSMNRRAANRNFRFKKKTKIIIYVKHDCN